MNNNYRALTRTYRPLTFDDIVSQEHVSNTLKNAIKNGRLSHAYMFCGPRGVGKTTMARVLARVVNEVDTRVDGESLSRTLNIVEMDAASNRKIEDIRSLKEVIRVPPQNGKYKIFIIDEVHMLTKEAFNALLKTLEEPPPHAIFIFATTEPHKVLPTVLSRVQRFDFKRISVSEIVDHLRSIAAKESISMDEESMHVIAKKADGALRDALGLMDQAIAFCGSVIRYKELLQALNIVDKEHLFEFMEKVKERNAHTGLTLIRDLLQAGTDIQEFLVSLTEHIRNLYVAQNENRTHLIEATDETKKNYAEQAKGFTEDDLMRMLHLVSDFQVKMKEAQQPKVQFEIMMLKMVHMSRTHELHVLLNELEELKKKSTNGQSRNVDSEKNTAKDQSGRIEEDENTETIADDSTELSDQQHLHHENTGDSDNGTSVSSQLDPETVENTDETPKINPVRPAVSYRQGAEETEAPEEEDLFGKPSLGYHQTGPEQPSRTDHKSSAEVDETDTDVLKAGKLIVKNVQDIQAGWKEFLNSFEKVSDKTLFLQVERLQVDSLEGRELVLKTDNEFARNVVEENRIQLTKVLKSQFGVALSIRCLVDRENRNKKKTLNPYEEFIEIQRKDPHIRTLIELFGAELDY